MAIHRNEDEQEHIQGKPYLTALRYHLPLVYCYLNDKGDVQRLTEVPEAAKPVPVCHG